MGQCTKCGARFIGTAENPPPDGLCRYCQFDAMLAEVDRLKVENEKLKAWAISELPVQLNFEQQYACAKWAADDRLWSTQEQVALTLKMFARHILERATATQLPVNF